jgi:hypothetical protein
MIGTLHEDMYIYDISCWILLKMRNVSERSCRENQNTHFVFNKVFSENCTLYEIMWKIWQSQTGHRWQYNAVQKGSDLYAR